MLAQFDCVCKASAFALLLTTNSAPKRFQNFICVPSIDPRTRCSSERAIQSSLLIGFPRPETEEGLRAFESEMRRRFTQQLRAFNEQIEKTCPSVFTLVPAEGFRQLDTWLESAAQEDELELALYCEHDSGWHPTAHSLYRFHLDKEWLASLKNAWNMFARVTKQVAPLAKSIGKASKYLWLEAGGMVVDKLPEFGRQPMTRFGDEIGQSSLPQIIDIESRYLLERLIEYLDSQRTTTEPKNGGLFPYLIEGGRLLWLCPDHLKLYKVRA